LCLGGTLRADDSKEPYRIRIVLDVAKHRQLTDVFRRQVARELADGLQAALGELAEVTVLRRREADALPIVRQVRAQGLLKGLDSWRELSPYKTHFVHISYTGVTYIIETRQHDGLTGLPSPVVRFERTRDPAYVGREAALLVERDLGLLGTVVSEPNADRLVDVVLKGGKLGVDLGEWVKKGQVFQLVRQSGAAPGQAEPWAILQVEKPAAGGSCQCRLYNRFRLTRVSGMRAVLLGTRDGTIRLRAMQQSPDGNLRPLATSVTLQVRHHGFEGEDKLMVRATLIGSKELDTAAPQHKGDQGIFHRLAFVSVLSGGNVLRARIPVPLIDDSLIILPVPAGNEESNLFLTRYRALQRDAFESDLVQRDLFKRINDLTAKPERRKEALAEVRRTIERCQQDYTRLAAERDEVAQELEKLEKRGDFQRLPAKDRPNLKPIDSRLEVIKAGETKLLKHLVLLEKIEKEESDPERKDWLIKKENAKALIEKAELGKAIEIYKKAPKKFQDADWRKQLDELEKQWKPRDDKHEKARDFIYKEWPDLDTPGVSKKIDEAVKMLDVCKKAGDLIYPAKLLMGTEQHILRMDKELEALKPDVNIDDEKPAKVIKDLLPKLSDLLRDIQSYLKKHRPE
jgi:hypothetical protein